MNAEDKDKRIQLLQHGNDNLLEQVRTLREQLKAAIAKSIALDGKEKDPHPTSTEARRDSDA